ncbi:MAG: DUF3054 family protein [Anaerolineales bacterium]|nr:DUF3054 family protein [Anaerolineales bacterium]
MSRSLWLVIIGDAVVYLLATILGFASHAGENSISLTRFLATLVPFTMAWFLISPWLGAYRLEKIVTPNQLWRPLLATLYAAPIGAFGRGLWLWSPILLLFVLIMAAVTAALMLLWRALLFLILRSRS